MISKESLIAGWVATSCGYSARLPRMGVSWADFGVQGTGGCIIQTRLLPLRAKVLYVGTQATGGFNF